MTIPASDQGARKRAALHRAKAEIATDYAHRATRKRGPLAVVRGLVHGLLAFAHSNLAAVALIEARDLRDVERDARVEEWRREDIDRWAQGVAAAGPEIDAGVFREAHVAAATAAAERTFELQREASAPASPRPAEGAPGPMSPEVREIAHEYRGPGASIWVEVDGKTVPMPKREMSPAELRQLLDVAPNQPLWQLHGATGREFLRGGLLYELSGGARLTTTPPAPPRDVAPGGE